MESSHQKDPSHDEKLGNFCPRPHFPEREEVLENKIIINNAYMIKVPLKILKVWVSKNFWVGVAI